MTKKYIGLQESRALAKSKYEALRPFCEIIDVAGSVRRSNYQVGDIEIVCLPKMVPDAADLFGGSGKMVRDRGFVEAVQSLGKIVSGSAEDGRFLKIDLPEEIRLDLFVPAKHDYYRQLVIRTGSAEYVKSVIAGAWVKLGWRGTPDGLRLAAECVSHKSGDKNTWECVVGNPTLPPVWSSEEAFFEWLGVKYIEPNQR